MPELTIPSIDLAIVSCLADQNYYSLTTHEIIPPRLYLTVLFLLWQAEEASKTCSSFKNLVRFTLFILISRALSALENHQQHFLFVTYL